MDPLTRNKLLGTDPGLSCYEFQAVSEYRYLDAMRLYRARRGVGLGEAKAAVNKLLSAAGRTEI